MKIKSTQYIIATLTFCALAPLTRAQCTQSCDNFNTAFGLDALTNDPGPIGDDTAIGDSALQDTTGTGNTAVGASAGSIVLDGKDNTAVGFFALGGGSPSDASFNTAIGAMTLEAPAGNNNTAVGYLALSVNFQGASNTASGANALELNTNGNNDTADGYQALNKSQTGNDNVATGRGALFSNTASNNTADGSQALNKNTSGTDNVAIGRFAMFNNTTGIDNTAIGRGALYGNKTASQNTACGYKALNVSTSAGNTAVGYQSLLVDTSGSNNVAIGNSALGSNISGSSNTAIGVSAGFFATGSGNIAIGLNAGVGVFSGSNNRGIGNNGANESSTIRIGASGAETNTYIAGINGVTVAGGIGVIIDSNGHLGTSTSSARYKDNIRPMDKASEAVLALQPVTFRYKKELDPQSIPQFGLVAEQVEKVDPDLVARDVWGKPYSVRYEAVNAMLLNEFLKEHRKVETLEATVAEQEKQIATLLAGLKQQGAAIENVSAQLAAEHSAVRVVGSN